MRRWALVGAVVTLTLLVLVLAASRLLPDAEDPDAGCATFRAERVADGTPAVELNESAVRADSAILADVLDRALVEEHATARGADAYAAWRALEPHVGDGRVVRWRGATLQTGLAVC